MSNGYLTGCALVFSFVTAMMILSKKSVKNIETKIFKWMLILNIFESLTTTLIVVFAAFNAPIYLFRILNRIDIMLIISWCSLMFYYIYIISSNRNTKIMKRFINISNGIMYICSLILSVEIIIQDSVLDSTGPLTYLGLIGALFYISLMILILVISIIKKKKIRRKKYIPLYILIILLIIIALLRMTIPEINFISILLTLIDLIMSFTIENPDSKMIEQLEENKKLIEQGNADKSNFLFRMAQEVKSPIDDIIRANKIIENSDDLETIKKCNEYIKYNSKELKMFVNGVFDISKMDIYNIKMIDSTYNINNVFTEVFTRYEKEIDKKINYRYKISNNLPEMLYGDSVKIKQVVTTILDNAVKYTKEGYIDINVDSIVKNNVCRLIISIEDSGKGMSIDKVNKLLNITEDLTEEELNKLNNMNLNINIATKIIRLLGGQLIIKSYENVGSEFTIIIDQKINDENTKNDYFDKYLYNTKKRRILLVNDKQKELSNISEYLEDDNIEVVKAMYAYECLDRINNKQRFDLIIVDDEMKPTSGINLLQQLKKLKKFKTPVVILLDNSKDAIKEHYLEDGFSDYILKKDLNKELDRVVNKFI